MKYLFVIAIGGVLFFTSSISSGQIALTKSEERALKYEIIELDVGIRNTASMISMGDSQQLLQALTTTNQFQTESSLRHQQSFRSLLVKLKQSELLVHFKNIHLRSKSLQEYITTKRRRKQEINWGLVQIEFNKILTNCRVIHQNTKLR